MAAMVRMDLASWLKRRHVHSRPTGGALHAAATRRNESSQETGRTRGTEPVKLEYCAIRRGPIGHGRHSRNQIMQPRHHQIIQISGFRIGRNRRHRQKRRQERMRELVQSQLDGGVPPGQHEHDQQNVRRPCDKNLPSRMAMRLARGRLALQGFNGRCSQAFGRS